MTDGLLSHATIFLKRGKMEAEIDLGIAQIIYGLWKAGINTRWSCEGVGGYYGIDVVGDRLAYISFTTAKNRSRFLKLMRGSGVKFLLDEHSWPGTHRKTLRFYRTSLPRIRKFLRLRGVPILSFEAITSEVIKSMKMADIAKGAYKT